MEAADESTVDRRSRVEELSAAEVVLIGRLWAETSFPAKEISRITGRSLSAVYKARPEATPLRVEQVSVLSVKERARIHALALEEGMTVGGIARRIGRNRHTVENCLAAARKPDPVPLLPNGVTTCAPRGWMRNTLNLAELIGDAELLAEVREDSGWPAAG